MKPTRQRRSETGVTADSPLTPTESLPNISNKPLGKGTRNSTAIKSETSDAESAKASMEKSGQFTIGSEVYYRNKEIAEGGEGILCKITNVIGEGSKRRWVSCSASDYSHINRYEVKDSADLDDGKDTIPHKVAADKLVPILPAGARLPELSKGRQIVALYPESTVFYRAKFVSTPKKDKCKLRFEDDDDDKEVERRYVLDVK